MPKGKSGRNASSVSRIAMFRRLALDLPEAIESAHMGTPDFRVGGKIFATLFGQETSLAMVKLTRAQQAAFMEQHPAAFAPIKGGWGRQGATQVDLTAASEATVRSAMRTAWRNVAPKRLLDAFILAPLPPRKTIVRRARPRTQRPKA